MSQTPSGCEQLRDFYVRFRVGMLICVHSEPEANQARDLNMMDTALPALAGSIFAATAAASCVILQITRAYALRTLREQ